MSVYELPGYRGCCFYPNTRIHQHITDVHKLSQRLLEQSTAPYGLS